MKIVRGAPPRRARTPSRAAQKQIADAVGREIDAVRREGDKALRRFAERAGAGLPAGAPLRVPTREFRRAFARLPAVRREALEMACKHVGALARRQHSAIREFRVKPTSGVQLAERVVPLSSAGIYVPASQISSLLMGAIPAAVAGVARRVVCTPAGSTGEVDANLLAAAFMCEVTELYAVGGVGAIAALAHGTQAIAPVDKIVGPTGLRLGEALHQVSCVCGVSHTGGPADLVILADHTAAPEFVAADLAAAVDGDEDAACMLITTDEAVAEQTRDELRRYLRGLPDDAPIRRPLKHALLVVVADLSEAVALANTRSPQHLQLLVKRPQQVLDRLVTSGTVLVGPQTPSALGSYVTGANDILPGRGAARFASRLGVGDFLRRVTVQQVDPSAYPRLARAAWSLAEMEGSPARRRAIAVRLGPVDE